MDLSPFTQSDTKEIIIKDPVTGEDTDIKMVVYGSDSKHYRSAISSLTEKGDDKRGIELLAKLTKSWENVEYDGKSLACNVENAMMIYANVPFLAAELEKVMFNRVNFMKSLGKKP